MRAERRALLHPSPHNPSFSSRGVHQSACPDHGPQPVASARAVQGGYMVLPCIPTEAHLISISESPRCCVRYVCCVHCTTILQRRCDFCFFTNDSCKRRVLSDVNNADAGSQLPCSRLRQCHSSEYWQVDGWRIASSASFPDPSSSLRKYGRQHQGSSSIAACTGVPARQRLWKDREQLDALVSGKFLANACRHWSLADSKRI